MKKNDLTWLKLFTLLVLLPLFLWFATLHDTVSQYMKLRELRKERSSAPRLEENMFPVYQKNMLTGDYLFKKHLGAAASDGCEIVSFMPSCDKTGEEVSLCRCHILVKGRFVPLLRLVNCLEEEQDIGFAMLRFSHKSEKEPLVSLDVDLIQLALNE